jgi:hypothetical protein
MIILVLFNKNQEEQANNLLLRTLILLRLNSKDLDITLLSQFISCSYSPQDIISCFSDQFSKINFNIIGFSSIEKILKFNFHSHLINLVSKILSEISNFSISFFNQFILNETQFSQLTNFFTEIINIILKKSSFQILFINF